MQSSQPYELQKLKRLANWLDNSFTVPGTRIGIGYDALIGLIPGIGDTLTTGISMYILHQAHQMGVPFTTKCRMGWHIFIDWLIGLLPLVGDIFDIGYRANVKNVRLIERHMEKNMRNNASRPKTVVHPATAH